MIGVHAIVMSGGSLPTVIHICGAPLVRGCTVMQRMNLLCMAVRPLTRRAPQMWMTVGRPPHSSQLRGCMPLYV